MECGDSTKRSRCCLTPMVTINIVMGDYTSSQLREAMAEAEDNKIGRREWAVMRYISDHHPIGVREVADFMAQERGLARTSVLTVMERLREKGFLDRKRDGRRWVYFPQEEKSELLRGFVRDFYENTLQSTLSPFVAYLSEETTVTDDQLDELKALVKNLEKKRAGKRKGGK